MRTSINDRMTPSCDLNVKLPKNPQKNKVFDPLSFHNRQQNFRIAK